MPSEEPFDIEELRELKTEVDETYLMTEPDPQSLATHLMDFVESAETEEEKNEVYKVGKKIFERTKEDAEQKFQDTNNPYYMMDIGTMAEFMADLEYILDINKDNFSYDDAKKYYDRGLEATDREEDYRIDFITHSYLYDFILNFLDQESEIEKYYQQYEDRLRFKKGIAE